MAKNSFIDTFGLCWDAILMESKDFKSTMFNEQHCLTDESRDTNFDTVENRLAYTYKFGNFNALFVQKCIESFLENYSDGEKLFLRDNLKICSLSNGPGLELVGLLCGIYENCQKLKSFPVLKTINLYNSWWSVCKRIFSSVFQAARAFSKDSFDIPSEIIHFIQSDIYSTLSPDVGECLKDSDILLMVKVFASTKATCDVVIKSMEEIFSFLKPGSFVFFVGSRKNTKELATNYSLSKFVSCILGPIKISVTDLPVHESVVESIGIKPKESGYAYFIVWQKKDSVSPEEIPKKKRRGKKKNKSKVKMQNELTDCTTTTVSKEMADDINECSDISFSSHSKQSETLSDEFNSASSENMSISPAEINVQNLEKEENNLPQKDSPLSLDSITSLLDKIDINSNRENLTEIEDIHVSRKGVGYLERNVQEREFENSVVKDVVVTATKNQGDLFNEISGRQTVDVEMVLTKASNKPETQLVGESDFCKIVNVEPPLTHHQNREANLLIQKYIHPMKDNTCLLDKSNLTLKSSNEESLQDMQLNSILSAHESPTNLKKSMQTKKLEIPVAAQDISSPSQVKQKKKKEIIANQGKDYPILKEDVYDQESTSKSSSRKSSINILYAADMLKTDIQNINVKKVSNTETMKVPIKNKKQSVINKKTAIPELNIENKTSKNGTRIIFENQSRENCLGFKINMTSKERTPETSNKNKDLNCLLERCESLVTSLEKLTANLKQSITLSYEGDSSCCTRESCAKFKVPHAYVNSCCANAIHSNCSRESCAKFRIPHANVNSCCANVVHSNCSRESCAKFQIPHAYVNSSCANVIHSNCSRKVYNCQMTQNATHSTFPRHFHAEIKPR